MRMIRDYADAKRVYEETKPIRGRTEDVRPLGKRHRDWETIRQIGLGADLPPAYAARLYRTNVVTWYADGTLGIKADGWHSTSTAQFIHNVSCLRAAKVNRKLWVWSSATKYPVPHEGELRLHRTETGWQPVQGYEPTVRQVQRSATAAMHKQLAPFLSWARTFLSLSDGVIQPETFREVLQDKGNGVLHLPEPIATRLQIDSRPSHIMNGHYMHTVQALCRLTEDEYLPMLCAMSLWASPFSPEWWPRLDTPAHVDYTKLKAWAYAQLRKLPENHVNVPYTPTDKFTKRVV